VVVGKEDDEVGAVGGRDGEGDQQRKDENAERGHGVGVWRSFDLSAKQQVEPELQGA
jgi:hypothetical protein